MRAKAANPKIVIICGPTGLGKTSTAIELAEKFNAEIIGADSMQIYRCMDIGTAKPTVEEQRRVKHHLIDCVDPDEDYDAARYAKEASAEIEAFIQQDILPFVVGGTGFYIKALLYGLFEGKSADAAVRQRLKQEAAATGLNQLYQRLTACDPETAANIHPNDEFRILRALEIAEITGKTPSESRGRHRFNAPRFDALKIGLRMEREALYNRINQRVDLMIAEGLLDEVKQLLDQGYTSRLKSMQSLGYRHMTAFLENRHSWDEAVRLMKRDTRRYAKRQMTWFKADPDVIWATKEEIANIKKRITVFLNRK